MSEMTPFPDEEALISGLGERGLPVWGASVVAPQIAAFGSPLREAFLMWWQTGEVSNVSVQDQSAEALVDCGLHPVAALLSLDSLERNPNEVKALINRGQEKFIPVLLGAGATNSWEKIHESLE